jgi:hypothetical protein
MLNSIYHIHQLTRKPTVKFYRTHAKSNIKAKVRMLMLALTVYLEKAHQAPWGDYQLG